MAGTIFDRLGIVNRHNATEAHAWEEEARARIEDDAQLRPYYGHIFYDWPNWDEHMEWLCCAPRSEIVEWVAVTLLGCGVG